jgi:hypothetical protein
MSLGLYHLLRWVDQGVSPPHANRVLLDRDVTNDGSAMALDAHGNPLGGIRNPYVDVPTAKYRPINTAAEPLIANPSAYVASEWPTGRVSHVPLERVSGTASGDERLRKLYGNKRDYVKKVEALAGDLEREGWSPPLYRPLILADATRSTLSASTRQKRTPFPTAPDGAEAGAAVHVELSGRRNIGESATASRRQSPPAIHALHGCERAAFRPHGMRTGP